MATETTRTARIYSIDILRGAVMIIMALDHVRDFFHIDASTDSPTNLATTTPILFFTRWITHFCAPTFVFLAGVSAYLIGQKKTKKELSRFLISRGAWLVLVEVLIISLAWTFNPFYNLIILQVIWAIGISMIILGIFVRFSYRVILFTGLIIVFCHNLLDYPEAAHNGSLGFFWDLAHHAFFAHYDLFSNHGITIVYAFLPWTGIMMVGYGAGKVFGKGVSAIQRKKILFGAGAFFILLFLILRFINAYGDPSTWAVQRSPLYTMLSFINVTKYPPSLDYIGVTIGVSLIVLGLFDNVSGRSLQFLVVFGRVPFFYYVLHLYLIHLSVMVIFLLEKFPAKDIRPAHSPFLFRPDHFGFGLLTVYGIWILLILLAYPLCKWYSRYKATHHDWWLSYL
jgi:uncharacterized membrane protein